MASLDGRAASDPVTGSLYDVDSADPNSDLVDRSSLRPGDIAEITAVMAAMGRLRDAEEALAKASQEYMELGQTDMRAVHYLIVAANRGEVVTPGALAVHLGISTASTTKLLDRLERGKHIVRSPHPSDRRALAITITPETHIAARDTVGRKQATRFTAAAALTTQERGIVARFLEDVAERMALGDEPWAARRPSGADGEFG
jgi:DNA-binding MarR family transcriptional regulator